MSENNRLQHVSELIDGSSGGISQEKVIETLSVIYRSLLVFGMAICESMLKAYFDAFRISDTDTINGYSFMRECEDHETNPFFPIPNEKVLQLAAWRKWVKLRFPQDAAKSSESSSQSGSASLFKDYLDHCQGFKHCKMLLYSACLRDLHVHNDGIMNEWNYKRYPLCKVGEAPVWDKNSMESLAIVLDCFNNHLAEFGKD